MIRRLLQRALYRQWRRRLPYGERARLDYWGATGNPNHHGPTDMLTDLTAIEDAIRDALSGWQYLREHHGDLYGVGWERVELKLRGALLDIAALGM